ncbi:TPR repeat-containing protein DDB_G0287407-like [Gigantopelta aegis]|uniref:TPR repeat-containing protein DDB_G0287407-like n=1 Tax=Gigantopelta aegis TaxID=1735272 RepID=UPI001B88DD78|nr:TPR repeat-containing protein DDB_G0287407-like [Gigantopelta aegis]
MPFPTRLKDPTTCRIFLSSPFRGMEEEREILMTKFIPELCHLCQAKGVSLVPVDMRWGITADAADNAQVVSICLKELDRADIFVGLFAQRYGWHGSSDKMLQKNFDNAVQTYPWINKLRDRSVTEVEFFHGFMENPGYLPACFVFRDKSYDDEQHQKLVDAGQNDLSYVAESESTATKLETLKNKIAKIKDKCLSLNFDYKSPKEGAKLIFDAGAKLIFDAVYKHLNEVLLKESPNVSKRDADLAQHDAFIANRSLLFVGGDVSVGVLNKHLESAVAKPVVILGAAGSGKSALLSHWLAELKKKPNCPVLLYHFAGSTADSTAIIPTLHRLINELELIAGDSKKKTKDEPEEIETLGPGLTSADCGELVQKFQVLLEKACSKKKVVFVIDGLDKMENISRIAKRVFWLPVSYPRGTFAVFSCRQDDSCNVTELTSARQYDVIKMDPLSSDTRKQMCLRFLKLNGKELSPAQLTKILKSEQTANPLFLKTVLSELCKFGLFRKLDEQIDSLVKAKDTVELFKHLLSRLEIDYCVKESKQNIVEQVMCCLYLCHKGLYETELRVMFHIPSITWSPLYFAMCNLLVDSGGLMQLQFDEMKEAIYDKYLKNESIRKKYLKILIDFFESQRKMLSSTMNVLDPKSKRPTEELPLLFKAMGDKNGLTKVLTDLPIFGRLFLDAEYELLELWKWTGRPGDAIANLYIAAMDMQIPEIAMGDQSKDSDVKRGADLLRLMYLDALTYLMELGQFQAGKEIVLEKRSKMLERFASSMDESKYQRLLSQIHLKLASLYTDTHRFQEAEKLHKQVLLYREKAASDKKHASETALQDLGTSYHAFGMFYFKTEQIDKAIELFTKSVELQRKTHSLLDVADSLHNLGVLCIKKGQHAKALKLCLESLQIYEEQYFGHLTPTIGVMLGNIAVCHRNLGNVQEAEKMYKKSLEINEKAFGRCHPNVAAVLKNLATMETNRENYKKAEEYYRETLDIQEKCETTTDDSQLSWIKERLVYTVLMQGRVKEAISMFTDLYQRVSKAKSIDRCWPVVYVRMVSALLEEQQYDLATKVTLDMIQSEVKQDMNFIHLDILDSMSKKRPTRPKEFSIDYALKKWPSSINLVKHKMERCLIPQEDSQALLEFLEKTDELCGLKQALFDHAIVWCEQQNKQQLVLAVAKHAANKFPSEEKYAIRACELLREKEKFAEAFPLAQQLMRICPDRMDISLYVSEIATRAGEYSTARNCFQTIISKHGKDKAGVEQAKAGLKLLESLEKTKLTRK